MATQRSLNRKLADSIGKKLLKEDVRILARRNAIASGIHLSSDQLDQMNEATLIQWATDFDGRYVDEQVVACGMVYR